MLEDLLDMLTNMQGFDGTIEDLKKMENIDELYKLAEKDITIEFEVEVVNPKFAYGVSMEDANFNFSNSVEEPVYDDQSFTGNWRKA